MDNDYLRQNLDKLLRYTRELAGWCASRQADIDRDQRLWYEAFEREYGAKVAAEAEALRKAKLKAEALSKLSPEDREALGV